MVEERKVYSLSQITLAIQRQIDEAAAKGPFWVTAEIASIKASNHAYLELAQHHEGKRVAVMRGIIWGSKLRLIRQSLGEESPNILKNGVEILFLAKPHFHPVYGLSLLIEAIDHSYTISVLQRRKQETLATLKAEGLYDRNRECPMPLVVQRIALVASPTSAAYADFIQHLAVNDHGYRFAVSTFPSAVQGDAAPGELLQALQAIDADRFDVVVLIRGGGSRLDLEPFNDLELARTVANMPLPVLTGIGHEVDISVLDLIAHTHQKTPTAVADWIVDRAHYFEKAVTNLLVQVQNQVLASFTAHKDRLARQAEILRLKPVSLCQTQRGQLYEDINWIARHTTERLTLQGRLLDTHRHNMAALARQHFQQLAQRMQGIHETIHLLSPQRMLERGFSVTRHGGKALLDPTTLAPGDEVETIFATGKAWSVISKTQDHEGGEADL